MATRAEEISKQLDCGLLQALDFTRAISTKIADEIEAYAEFVEVEGDIYGMAGGLRKAASIARHYEGSDNATPNA